MSLRRSKAHADPSKAFFVRMLTRDISLEDCILDLVDNSIDGAWEQSGEVPNKIVADDALSDFVIHIDFDQSKFLIRDNCGGITLDEAADYAFTFGRREDQTPESYSVGVYGIGMKRAVFKLGEEITIRSTYQESGNIESFRVPIDVATWMGAHTDAAGDSELHASWDFDIEADSGLAAPGVEIRIDKLRTETSDRLGDEAYARSLRTILGRDYMVPLMRGLKIVVNGTAVVGQTIELRSGADFAPMRDTYQDGEVTVEIIAGMMDSPPDSGDPEENDKKNAHGWYILCNGRAILAADKTEASGWGRELPRWHRQYSGFVGVAMFSAERAAELPMTTTKRNVDLSSAVYRRALTRMFAPTRAWIDYTNTRKFALDAAKSIEEQSEAQSLKDVPQRSNVELPKIPGTKATREPMANVNYAVPKRKMAALAKGMGDKSLSQREVGIRSFDFAYESLVGDEE